MTYDNELDEYNTWHFVGDLSDNGIAILLAYPELSVDFLEHADACERCSQRVEDIINRGVKAHAQTEPEAEVLIPLIEQRLEDLCQSLPAEKREEMMRLLARMDRHIYGGERAQARGATTDSPDAPRNRLHDSLPADIIEAGRKMGLSAQQFLTRLVGFSVPSVAAARAASGKKKLVADLRWFRGGSITLELERSGYGKLRGKFSYPTFARVFVYDVALGRVLALAEEPGEPGGFLEINSGDSLRRVRVDLSEVKEIDDLRLIALRAE